MKTLICFTASYPYGQRETYFEIELAYLAKNFEKVVIVPRYNPSGSSAQRPVPDNVKVLSPAVSQGSKRIFEGTLNTAPLRLYLIDFLRQKPYKKKSTFFRWANSLLTFRKTYQVTKTLLKKHPKATLYAYWAESPLFVTSLVRNFKKVVRMHGGDFYTERNNGYLPLRQEIYNSSQLLLPISKNIHSRLERQYMMPKAKLFLNYLGVFNRFQRFDLREHKINAPIVLVSCSNLVPLKRVALIVTALKKTPKNRTVIWHHFGDGLDMKALKVQVQTMPEHVTVHLHGWTQQQKLFEFYNNTAVTWFLNVSRYEGLPVSIMEAFSAAIPVIATDVGGTSEIVNDSNGKLIPLEVTPAQLLATILGQEEKEWKAKSDKAYQTWKTSFSADKNYKCLIQKLQKL